MVTAPLDAQERAQLCDLFLELGPDAPTLCEGWSTLDLAAHLVMRERDPRSGAAILGGRRFSKLEQRLMDRSRAKGYESLVGRLRSGPPPIPWRTPGLRTLLNLNEWFVHHEDARRANDRAPRTDVDDLEAALWASLRRSSRMLVRGMGNARLVAVAPGYGDRNLRGGWLVRESQQAPARAVVTGSPQELVLYFNGRRDAAQVELSGDPEALGVLAGARLGL